jgi:hypothetical protein
MRVKLLLVTLLLLSNVVWFEANQVEREGLAWLKHERDYAEEDRDYWMNRSWRLNDEILAASRLPCGK